MTFVANTFRGLGLEVSIQQFSYGDYNDKSVGYNVHGIFRASRGEGTEAIVLAVPYILSDDLQNENGLYYALSMASFVRKYSFWAKDIIFLVSSHKTHGLHAWLNAYHGVDPQFSVIQYEPLQSHAGSLISAINLEFPGTQPYNAVGLYTIGINGLLPNTDLVTTVIRSIQYEGIPLQLYDGKFEGYQDSDWGKYKTSALLLWEFIKEQSLGLPDASHSLFPKYKVEGLTIRGLRHPNRQASVDVVNVARAVETALRSLNNLLEILHHAFWFYFMPSVDTFIPISVYLAPIAMIAASATLHSLALWWKSVEEKKNIESSAKQLSGTEGKAKATLLKREPQIASFATKTRPLFLPAITLASCLAAGGWFLNSLETLLFIASRDQSSTLFVGGFVFGMQSLFCIALVPFLHRLTQDSGSETKTTVSASKIVKVGCCGLLGVSLVVLTATNPSLAILVAIPSVPVFLLIRPCGSLMNVLQMFILNILSPPGIVFVYCLATQNTHGAMAMLVNAMEGWKLFGSQIIPLVCLVLWPLNLAGQVLVGMEE